MRLLLIRHGETHGNHEERFQGKKEYALTERGKSQIARLGKRLSDEPLRTVYCSSLTRAEETAKAICESHELEPMVDHLLDEYSWGVIEGYTRAEIKEKYPELGMKLEENFYETSIPHEEGLMNLKNRVSVLYTKLVDNHQLENPRGSKDDRNAIAVVSHGRVIGGLLAYLVGFSFFHTPWPFQIDNASITELIYLPEYDHWKIVSLNDTCHLKALNSKD